MTTDWDAYFKMWDESDSPPYKVYDYDQYADNEGPIRVQPVL